MKHLTMSRTTSGRLLASLVEAGTIVNIGARDELPVIGLLQMIPP